MVAAAALGGAAVLAAYPVLSAGSFDSPLTLLAGIACGALAAGLVSGRAALLAWALGGLGCEYAAGLLARSAPLDLGAPLYGAGLLLVAELGYFSLELQRTAATHDRGLLRRLYVIAALAAAVLVAGGVYEAAAILPSRGGVLVTLAGVAAAVVAAALLARLATAAEP